MRTSYTPPTEILEKYAELIVQFGLQRQDGTLLPKGSVVEFTVPEAAKPLYFYLQRAILKNGYHPHGKFIPSSDAHFHFSKDFFTFAKKSQLEHFDKKYHTAYVDMIDAQIFIIAETELSELNETSGMKIMQQQNAQKPLKDMRLKKIDQGKLSWTLAVYGTKDMAKEADMSERAYWKQIIEACYLDTDNPIKEWRRITKTAQAAAAKLTNMNIKTLHWKGEDMDITVGIGADRVWRVGGGNNIPSYEVFTSPNMHQAEGWIRFNQPHFRYGKKIEGIELRFKNGEVIKAKATKNESLLKQMLKAPGGSRLGEVSLTDRRLSRILKPTGEIIYDENIGGTYGNTHIAIGSSFHDCYNGKQNKSAKQWAKLGFNESVVHSDFVSTSDRTVTAILKDGSSIVIYKDGMFTL